MTTYITKEEVLEQSRIILNKSLYEIMPSDQIEEIERKIYEYKNQRKGYLGELIEWYVFGKKPDGLSQADFNIAGVELKATPLKKHKNNIYASKERLVFSMINYEEIVKETWEKSSFLKKNKVILLMFYLWIQSQSILDYEFKYIHLLDLLNDLSDEDVFQIQKDWEYIVEKIKRGEAHLLSEGDTYYLGACTKAANSRVVRDQPMNRTLAKPRAFSFKQQYINYLIQTKLLKRKTSTDSIFKKQRRIETIESVVKEKFALFINKTDEEILKKLNSNLGKKSKSYKRLIVNQILGVKSNNIEELEKANITLKVVTLEYNGRLKESISFPFFKYKDLVNELWYDEENENMAELHLQLETKKFMFVVFQKVKGSDDIILRKTMFWNFPMKDISKARDVWEKTVDFVSSGKIVKEIVLDKKGKEKRITYFPGMSFNGVVHVRPHGSNSRDVNILPVADLLTGQKSYTKQCFWLNAGYIQQAIENDKDQA
ncbi:MAG: Sau3AI family type II restriction endonuclease [Candidatus Nomurabacteria bacterium]|nr:Sau3AI family type II restriction endonuclease [Candidatus Nomurabacteria bacterium]